MRRTFISYLASIAIAASSGAAMAQAPAPATGGAAAVRPTGGGLVQMVVESKAFPDGGIVPIKYSFYGSNTQPDFRLSNLSANAQTIAIILHDLDVASGGNPDDVLHWIAWNIPVSNGVAVIEEGKLPNGAVGKGMRGPGYMGMGAPNGPRFHHYVFEFYALNTRLDLPATASRQDLWDAMKGKAVAKAAYVGRFRNDTNAPRPDSPPAAPPRRVPAQ